MIPKKLFQEFIVIGAVIGEAEAVFTSSDWHQAVYYPHGDKVGENNDDDAVEHWTKIELRCKDNK
ncbi:hypothetical protein [Marivirga sp.]|uniref:hypothetical protein n=1 Tax=Marivirga sp. TaxID=2018662 RepID=UPI002D7ED22C|nr:hypothetical protein [Marivirga sp.]HET8860565.1 hypothetical protein [Marivirga sp.]